MAVLKIGQTRHQPCRGKGGGRRDHQRARLILTGQGGDRSGDPAKPLCHRIGQHLTIRGQGQAAPAAVDQV